MNAQIEGEEIVQAVAERHGVSMADIRSGGIKRRVSRARHDAIAELSRRGLNGVEIGALVKMEKSAVNKVLRRSGLGRADGGGSGGLTKDGACDLAQAIATYWAQRGYSIRAEVAFAPSPAKNQPGVWTVRTDMVNGLPKDFKPSKVKEFAL